MGTNLRGLSVQIGGFLDQPPGVFLAAAVIVVAVADPVERGGIESHSATCLQANRRSRRRRRSRYAGGTRRGAGGSSCRPRRFDSAWMRSRSPASSGWTPAAARAAGSGAGVRRGSVERQVGGECRHLEVDVEDARRRPLVAEVLEVRLRVHLGLPAQAAVGAVKREDRPLRRLNQCRAVIEQAVAAGQRPRRRPRRRPIAT